MTARLVPPEPYSPYPEYVEPALPGLTSFTRTVPVAVPSDFHSSRPCASSKAVK